MYHALIVIIPDLKRVSVEILVTGVMRYLMFLMNVNVLFLATMVAEVVQGQQDQQDQQA
jgi:hypothetical protein